MMKYTLILTLLLTSVVNSQNLTFTYKKISNEKIEAVKLDRIKSVISSIPQVSYELIVNDSISSFTVINKVYTPDFNKGAISYGGGSNFYVKKKNNELQSLESTLVFNDSYLKKSTTFTTDWKITNESKVINGYICYKAIIKREKLLLKATNSKNPEIKKIEKELVAWFCPEFPYSFGPDEFFGLPGIIFEAHHSDGKILFAIDKIELKSNKKIKATPKLKLITEEEAVKYTLDIMKNNLN
jgi:GLPGLI family protein